MLKGAEVVEKSIFFLLFLYYFFFLKNYGSPDDLLFHYLWQYTDVYL